MEYSLEIFPEHIRRWQLIIIYVLGITVCFTFTCIVVLLTQQCLIGMFVF